VSGAAVNPAGVSPGGATFKVTGFDIEGNSVIPTAELQAQIASYVGQTLTLAQLYDVADVLTRYYRSKGYGLAYVAPPAQTLKGGNARLQVIEGRVGKVTIQGNSRTRGDVLARRVEGLNPGDVYTNAASERAVMLMNDLPGLQARAVLSPGDTFGTSDVLFDVNESGYSGDVSVDDYGRVAIGRWRISADVNVNSLTGSGDQLSAGVVHSENNLLNFGKLGYQLPVGTSSTLSANYNRAFYHVGGEQFGGLGIEGSTQSAGLNWLYTDLRTRSQSLYWGVGVTYNNSRNLTGCCGTTAPPSDRLTTNIMLLQLTMLYNRQYEDQSYWTLGGNFWSNGKSNSDGVSKSAEKGHFEFDGSYVKPFADSWDFVAQGALAYSLDPLVDSDKYSLGGPGNVRGFQSAEARGDKGVFGSLELQRAFTPSPKFPLSWGVFLDSGKVWTKAVTVAGKLTIASDKTGLTSVGTELQLLPSTTGWTARLQFAWAVGGNRPSDDVSAVELAASKSGPPVEHDHGPHIWFTLAKSF
jgi:hemolysin activation/secretion protein